jgi:hypothetical protein
MTILKLKITGFKRDFQFFFLCFKYCVLIGCRSNVIDLLKKVQLLRRITRELHVNAMLVLVVLSKPSG